MNVAQTLFVILGVMQAQSVDLPDPHELETRAVARRERIRQGVFDVTSSGWKYGGDGSTRQEFGVEARITIDEEQRRSDIIRTDQPSIPPEERPRKVKCHADDVHIYYDGGTAADGSSIMMNVVALDQFSDSITMRVVDPRALGLIPTGFANTVQYERNDFVGTTEYKSIEIEADTLAGLECWRITKLLLSGVTVRSWIAPGRGDAVVRVETRFEEDNQTHVHSVQSELAYHEAIDGWYPTACEHRVEVDGEVVRYERTTIQVTGLNEPVDPATFTIAGMDIPAGTGVNMMPASMPGLLRWDGREIVSSLQAPPAPRAEAGRLAWIVAATLSAAVAAACVWWLFLRGAPPRRSAG